jgi:ribosome biogenesis protein YTM1
MLPGFRLRLRFFNHYFALDNNELGTEFLLLSDPPQPFDFLIDGKLLRSTLERHLLASQQSAEAVVSIEYIPALGPPKEKLVAKQDDWVSSVCVVPGRKGSQVITGSYDYLAR